MDPEDLTYRYLALIVSMESGKYPEWEVAFTKWNDYFDRLNTDDQGKYSKSTKNFIEKYKSC